MATETTTAAFVIGQRIKCPQYTYRTAYPVFRESTGALIAFATVEHGYGKGWRLQAIQAIPAGSRGVQYEGFAPDSAVSQYLISNKLEHITDVLTRHAEKFKDAAEMEAFYAKRKAENIAFAQGQHAGALRAAAKHRERHDTLAGVLKRLGHLMTDSERQVLESFVKFSLGQAESDERRAEREAENVKKAGG